jgi:penicillin-binding protein 1C
VLDILRGAATPDGFAPTELTQADRRIAVKTGTSFGFRDAWAVGVSASHSVGVWVGRPDGAPSPGRYGRNTAAPLTRQIFDHLPSDALPASERTVLDSPPPDALRRLTSRRADPTARQPQEERLTLVFPPAGALLPRPESGDQASFTLRAVGGRRPLAWLVDGKPLPAPGHRREARWTPEGQGFFSITVIDSEGTTASASVRIR